MEGSKFNKGDIVQLQSGGQKMTVEDYSWNDDKKSYRNDKFDCTWFVGKTIKRESFFDYMLKKVDS